VLLFLLVGEVAVLKWMLADDTATWRAIILMPLAMLPVAAFGLAGCYFAAQTEAADSYANVVGGVSAALFLTVSARAVRVRFSPVIEAEKEDASRELLSRLKWQAYLAISTAYLAALLTFIDFVIGTTPSEKWVNGRDVDYGGLLLQGVLLLVLVGLIWTAGATASRLPDSLRLLLAAVGCLVWTAVVLSRMSAGYGDWRQSVLSVVVAAVSGLFILEGVTANAGSLHNSPVDWRVWAVAVASALSVATTVTWITGPALYSAAGPRTVGAGLVGLAVGALACVLLPYLSARILPGARPTRQYAIATPLAGVLQDSFLVTLLAISAGWAPNFFLAHVRGVSNWWGAVLSYLALLSAAYVYVMKNNVGHVSRERERVTAKSVTTGVPLGPDDHAALAALAGHIRRQNWLAAVALFPLGIFLIANEITGFDEEGLGQILKVG
jgi:hypothetical protein